MSAEDAKKNLLSLPWVKAAKPGTRCEGIKWGLVALRDTYSLNGNPPRGIQERAKCRRAAKFVFRATKKTRQYDYPATSGSYCFQHVGMQISDHSAEERRANAFLNKNGWWRNGVFGFHGKESE